MGRGAYGRGVRERGSGWMGKGRGWGKGKEGGWGKRKESGWGKERLMTGVDGGGGADMGRYQLQPFKKRRKF